MQLDDLKANGAPGALHIGIVAPDAPTIENLRQMLSGWDGALQLPASALGSAEQAERLADQDLPDVMLVQGAARGNGDLPALERLTARHPGMAVVLLAADQSPEFLRQCMRAGLREILPMMPQREALLDALLRVQQRRAAGATGRAGKVYTFIGCKGGSGATFLAANLGHAMARDGVRRVALIDLNCQFGDAAFYLSQHAPACHLADVAQQVDRLDGELLASMMLPLAPNFHLLPAPEQPDQALSIRAEQIDKLLWVAARRYDVVIIDAGRSLDALTVRAMDRSDRVFAVLQLSLPFVRDAKRLLTALRTLGYGRGKVRLLVNRYEKNGAISLADVVGTLGYEVYRTVPNSFDRVAASANQGVPIRNLAPRDPVSRALDEMADTLSDAPKAQAGWLRNLLPRRQAAAST